MKIKINSLSIENFCGIKKLDTQLYEKTIIKGKNAVGKSTIRNAIFWTLYNKLADGSSPDGIRPHDENGNDIDFIDIAVTMTLDVDGREITLKKVQKQKWTKPKGSQEKRFDGNVNEFEINGIPKKEKDYTAYIEDYIAPMETLMFCTNAAAFLSMDSKKRRAKLLSLERDFSYEDVIATDKKYLPLAGMLADGTIDELIARSKKVIKAKNDELKIIPARIDELEKQKVDIDVAELELERASLSERITRNRADQEEYTKWNDEVEKGYRDLMELEQKRDEIVRKANDDVGKARRAADMMIVDLEGKKHGYQMDKHSAEWDLDAATQKINDAQDRLESARNDYRTALSDTFDESTIETIKAEEFDENTLICPTCKRELPEEQKETLRAGWEKSKADRIAEQESKRKFWEKMHTARLARITADGNTAHADKAKGEKDKADAEKRLEEANRKITDIEKQIADKQLEFEELPTEVDLTQNAEYQSISAQINDKGTSLHKAQISETSDGLQELINAENVLRNQLEAVLKEIARAENNVRIDDRIGELHDQQRDISQAVANEEQMLDLMEDFNRARVGLLTERVNRHFSLVKWQMFKKQINGGYAEVCIPTIGGTSYDGLLNNGNKILAEIDICEAFQKVNGITCPVMTDNAESVDSWRVPETDSQMILFMRTDDSELKIEEVR